MDIVTIKGWDCIVTKDSVSISDIVVYIPIDSILSVKLAKILFPPESKITIKNNRIKTIKLRGAISQGLCIPFRDLIKDYPSLPLRPGKDVKKILEITKFEAKEKAPFITKGQQKSKKQLNPSFRKYTDINHFGNYSGLFQPDEEVVVSEKIHGTNFRAGYVKINHLSFFAKWFRICKSIFTNDDSYLKHPGYEFCYGSHNVQLQNKFIKKCYYNKNVYLEMVKKYNLINMLDQGYVVYGEIFGDGIQKKYNYGLKNEIDFIVIDIKKNGRYLSFDECLSYVLVKGFRYAPILYRGPFEDVNLDELLDGSSVLSKDQKIREGIVIKNVIETESYMGRRVFKYINPAYLLKDNTEWH